MRERVDGERISPAINKGIRTIPITITSAKWPTFDLTVSSFSSSFLLRIRTTGVGPVPLRMSLEVRRTTHCCGNWIILIQLHFTLHFATSLMASIKFRKLG